MFLRPLVENRPQSDVDGLGRIAPAFAEIDPTEIRRGQDGFQAAAHVAGVFVISVAFRPNLRLLA